jgi:hypothetical protein
VETRLTNSADSLVAAMAADNPCTALARHGATLRTHSEPQRLPGKRIFGAWDPLLRRVDLYSCDATSSDEQLVGTLVHEFWHVLADESHRATAPDLAQGLEPDTEAAAQRFAALVLERLRPSQMHRCASALRQRAIPAQAPGARVPTASVGPITADLGL